jgi:hypothetical protein
MSVTMNTDTHAHGELDCADAEALLHDTMLEAGDLRLRLERTTQSDEMRDAEMANLRAEADRLHALLRDVTAKNTSLAIERDGLAVQNKYLAEELAAVEADAVPEGTLLFAPIPRDFMVAQYRRASRIGRGPLPPSVTAAVESAHESIVEAMTTAGQDAVTAVVRREVRRRRRAATTRAAR